MRFPVILGLMMVLGLLVGAEVHPAQAQSSRNEAVRHFREGQKHFNLSEFEEALKEFKESYRLKDDPTLLFNIGQCQWKLGDLRAAIHSYRAYLRMGKDVPNRVEVQARIREAEERLRAEEPNSQAGGSPTASTQSSAAPAPNPSSTPQAAGTTPDASNTPESAKPMWTEPRPVALTLPQPVAQPQPTRPEPAPAATASRPFYTKWWFWTAVGAAVAGGVLAAFLLSSSSPRDPACPSGVKCE